jgi:hypothetical protein
LRRLLLPNSLVPQLYSPFSLFISSLLSSLRNGEDMDIEEGYAKGRNVRRDESRLEMKREKGE